MLYALILGGVALGSAALYALSKRNASAKTPEPEKPKGTTLASVTAAKGITDTSAVQKVSASKVDEAFWDEGNWSQVSYNGDVYLVSRDYIAPVGIGEALKLAKEHGYELPSPGLADAIWKAADMKVMPHPMSHDGSYKGMNSDDIVNRHRGYIAAQVQEKGGEGYKLIAGPYKEIAVDPKSGKHGIYGWHIADGDIPDFKKKNPGVPVQAAVTPNLGAHVVQDFPSHHADDWRDYSQGARMTRKITQQA